MRKTKARAETTPLNLGTPIASIEHKVKRLLNPAPLLLLILGLLALQGQTKLKAQEEKERPPVETLKAFIKEVLNIRPLPPKSEEELRQYPTPPRAGSFGHYYDDEYAIDPSERPIPFTPALPLSEEEQKLRQLYLDEQEERRAAQKKAEKLRFNRELRIGLGFEAFFGIPDPLIIGGPRSSPTPPIPFIYDISIADPTPRDNEAVIFDNYYELSLILHLNEFFEIQTGLGYQTNIANSPTKTIGDTKQYFGGLIEREAPYILRYQRDIFYYSAGFAFTLPWVLNGNAKTVLGLRGSALVGFGIVTQESLGLAAPTLPDQVFILDSHPVPTYKIIDSFPLQQRAGFTTKFSFSLGGYFELLGFRAYIGYSLHLFPEDFYPKNETYNILANYEAGELVTYNTVRFPSTKLIHTIHLSLHYFLNPLELIGRRSIYTRTQRDRRRKHASRTRYRTG